MRPDHIVLLPPHFDHNLCLLQRIEDLPCKQLISHLPVERLNVAVFPGTAWLDEQRFDFQPAQPGTNFLGSELGAIIRTQVNRHAAFTKQLSQDFQYIFVSETACDFHGKTLAGIFIDHIQDTERIAILGMVLDEVSMSANSIPAAKRMIRSLSLEECQKVAQQVLDLPTVTAVQDALKVWVNDNRSDEIRP